MDKFKRLTPIQREIPEMLNDGKLMTIDRYNMPSIENQNVAPSTRYFLTDNKFVTKKDKSKAITTKGNGYIITDKGKKLLELNQTIKRRTKSARVLLTEKECGRCLKIKSISSFVNVYGYKNPRGKYCYDCFHKIEQEHAISLLGGRNFCLYCGKKITKVYDWTEHGKSAKTYIHLDHMDPISLGGLDSERNTVYCCVECNLKKGDKLFVEWLRDLKPEFQELSKDVYIKKHHREPEKFKPNKHEIIITFK